MLLNREGLAKFLNRSLRTVDAYSAQGMPGEPPHGKRSQWQFDSGQVVEWLLTRERQNALGEIAEISAEDAKRRKLAAEAAIAEHELAEKQGAAVSVEDWQSATSQIVGAARAKLLGIGAAVGRDVAIETDAAICESIVQSAINEALLELSEGDIQIESGGVGEPEQVDTQRPVAVGSAAGPDRKRVGRRRKATES